MPLSRVLEPEVMDSPQEAIDYDSMDHSEVNRRFVADWLEAGGGQGDVLDLGTGTALIPIEICRRTEDLRIMAVDAAPSMLDAANYNIEADGFGDRIQLDLSDAKQLPYEDGLFADVISNSIIHHIPEPAEALAEAVRVTADGGLLFFRDLMRPEDEQQLQGFVEQYAGQENERQQKMFADSLRAALTLEEIRQLVGRWGFDSQTVKASSDRHWTWTARKPSAS